MTAGNAAWIYSALSVACRFRLDLVSPAEVIDWPVVQLAGGCDVPSVLQLAVPPGIGWRSEGDRDAT